MDFMLIMYIRRASTSFTPSYLSIYHQHNFLSCISSFISLQLHRGNQLWTHWWNKSTYDAASSHKPLSSMWGFSERPFLLFQIYSLYKFLECVSLLLTGWLIMGATGQLRNGCNFTGHWARKKKTWTGISSSHCVKHHTSADIAKRFTSSRSTRPAGRNFSVLMNGINYQRML